MSKRKTTVDATQAALAFEEAAVVEEEFSVFDVEFARLMSALASNKTPELTLAARRVSLATRERNVCTIIEGEQRTALLRSGVVGTPDDTEKPMILDGHGRLYLNRYWQYEQTIASAIRGRLEQPLAPLDSARVAARLEEYFPAKDAAANGEQRIAAEHALGRKICIISGGPGTGKTTTVAVILALLIEFSGKDHLHIELAAPTGKAAARLQESIVRQKHRVELPIPAWVKEKIPEEATTMHRLLKTKPGTPYFRHDSAHPLPADVIVLDECSMIDAALMAKFMDALGDQTQVILLGDKDQLSSVEAGAVFSELCAANLECTKHLTVSHRFTETSGIRALSAAVNAGDVTAVAQAFDGKYPDIGLSLYSPEKEFEKDLAEEIVEGYTGYFQAPTIEEAFKRLTNFRILCALRENEYGVHRVNAAAEEVLKRNGLIEKRGEAWYKGCPVMITENNYSLGLSNGDTGIVWPDGSADGALAVFFQGAAGTLMKYSPFSLPAHEIVYAMTIHKSQGSQFRHVLTILPHQESLVVTRELLYTAVTRAEERADIWASETVLHQAVTMPTVRLSGLKDALTA